MKSSIFFKSKFQLGLFPSINWQEVSFGSGNGLAPSNSWAQKGSSSKTEEFGQMPLGFNELTDAILMILEWAES